MAKRVAILVRSRQGEALRVAVGLTLADNRVEVHLLDRRAGRTPAQREHLAALADAGMEVFTNTRGDADLPYLPDAGIARRILACDHVIVY